MSIDKLYIGRRVIARASIGGVHMGTLIKKKGTEVVLRDALRLWSWEGALSLSVVATKGITGGRLNRTPELILTGVGELIPITAAAWDSYQPFVE